MVSDKDIKNMADILYEAEKDMRQVPMLTEKYPELTVQDAYKVQFYNVRRRMERGETISGIKIGLTNDKIQAFLGAKEPMFGILTDAMRIEDDSVCDADGMLQPKVEGEMAFVMKKAVTGTLVTEEEILDAVDYVVPALEIIDSRVKDWKVMLPDMIADNGSAAHYAAGRQKLDIHDVDLHHAEMNYVKNGQVIASGTLANVLGSPLNALIWLVRALAQHDLTLSEGSIVLSGAITGSVPVKKGDTIAADFPGLGYVTAHF
ncbi:MAG: fumarylacetoacetate hydrolase family protein [Clostridiales bacterium]|nr:fumarylacetoacetate hydrolase family protein [Clostridiales bacterium]